MALALKSNVYSDVYITGNCIVTGTMTTLANPVNSLMTILQDQKAQGTTGGTNGTGWQTRTLNIAVLDQIGVNLTTNQFTLPAGTYHVQISTPACQTNNHRCRLYNVTTSTVILLGTSECAQNSNPSNMSNRSFIDGYFTSAASGSYRIDQYFQTAYTNAGLGMPSLSGGTDVEIYTTVKIIKINSGAALNQWTTGGTSLFYNSGNVGVGVTNPTHLFNVLSSGSAIANLCSSTTSTGSYMLFANSADNRSAFCGIDGIGLFNFSAGALALGTNSNVPIIFAPNYNSGGEKMRVTGGGLVGIGTAAPIKLIHGYAAAGSDEFRLQSTAVTIGMGINSGNNFGFLYNRTNNALVFGTNDAERMRLSAEGFLNLASVGTFTGVASFDTIPFDLVTYNLVEITMSVYFSTTNLRVLSSQLVDTAGTASSPSESGWQMFAGATTATASGTGANILNNTEIISNTVGGFIVVIRIIGNMGLAQNVRNHWEWTTTGCYAGVGASTTFGRATIQNPTPVTINRMRFNLSGGTMTGKYSIRHYNT